MSAVASSLKVECGRPTRSSWLWMKPVRAEGARVSIRATTAYEYDSLGRRTARILPAGEREEMTYDSLGRLTALKDFNGSVITRTYDPLNDRLLAVVAPANHPSLTLNHAPARYEFGYDVLGRRTAAVVKNASGTAISSESYFYDVRPQLTGYSGPTGGIGYGYVNGVQHAYTYNAVNRLTALAVSSSNPQSSISNPQSLHTYAYTLNKNGHRTLITELSGRTIANGYDALLRLTSETKSVSVSPTAGTPKAE